MGAFTKQKSFFYIWLLLNIRISLSWWQANDNRLLIDITDGKRYQKMTIEEYPQISFYSMTKSEWDSIFNMIPWLEEIELIDPNETLTDHKGTRTRPLKYVKYKSASVQLIGRMHKLLKPFEWINWEEGLKILKDETFTELDLISIGKLLTIILYYKESTNKLSPLGIACQAHDLEDGRVLKILKELKNTVTEIQKSECQKFLSYNPRDSNFANYAKLLQSKWRDKKGYPIAKLNETDNYGHFIDKDFAINEEVNYLTENIQKLVIKELEIKATIQEHIYENLLSSKSLCYNLFGELHFNHELATSLFKNIFPKSTSPYSEKLPEIGEVTAILFNYSPYNNKAINEADKATFDVFIKYTSDEGKKGFIGIDVKYAETLNEEADEATENYKKYENEYLKLATEDLFLKENLNNFKKPQLFYFWGKHLLSISLLKNNLYEEGFFLFLFPYGNEECYKEANLYRAQQKFPYRWNEHQTGYYWRFLDEFIDNLDKLVNQNWMTELKERYLGK